MDQSGSTESNPIVTRDSTTPSAKTTHPIRRVLVFAAVLLSIGGAGAIGRIWYLSSYLDPTVYTVETLKHGTVTQIIPWDDGRTAVQISHVSDIPADRFWEIITHHHNYHDLMPGVEIVSEREQENGRMMVEQILNFPRESYEIELEVWTEQEGPVRKWKWRQIKGPLHADDGAFVVEDHGDRTMLRYQVSASVPEYPQWLVNYTMIDRHADLFELMERHARELPHDKAMNSMHGDHL